MATSLMMNTIDNNNNVEQGYSQPIRRGGRKKAKNEQKKKNKEPQRGMGVEKLERMRIQEILKTSVLTNNNNNLTFVSDPNLLNAFQYSKFGGFPNGQQMGLFGVGPGSSVGSKSCVTKMSFSNKNDGFKCQSEYCTPTSCSKKKKRFDGGNMGYNKVKQDKMCLGDSGFLGLSVGNNQNNNDNLIFNQENCMSTGFKTHQVSYATRPGKPGVEVLAVHKKSNDEIRVMEYEFFPTGSFKKESRNDELVMMDQNNNNTIGDEEEITTCLGIGVPGSGSFDASSVDLSLKLSY